MRISTVSKINATLFRVSTVLCFEMCRVGKLSRSWCILTGQFGLRSKYCLEFSIITWWRLKIPGWLFSSCTIFEVYLMIICDFLKFNFSYFTPQVRLLFVVKRKPKTFRFKNAMERGIRIKTFSLSWNVNLHLKFSGK